MASLYEHAAKLAAAGDLEAARELHATIGRMLGVAGPAGEVVDLDRARQRSKR